MNPDWFAICCAVAGIAAFPPGHRWAQSQPWRRRAWLAAGAALLALPGASFAAYYTHLVPEPAWYFEFRSWRGAELALIPVGIAGGMVAALLPRRLLVAPLLATVACLAAPVAKPFLRPIPPGTFKQEWDGNVCLQSTPSTCGPASLATILESFGIRVTEDDLAREAHSYARGTEAWYLARVARDRGCSATFHTAGGLDNSIPLPAIAGVRIGDMGHYIPILSREGDQFRIGDPLNGAETLSRQDLLERYHFTGFHLSVSRPGSPGAH